MKPIQGFYLIVWFFMFNPLFGQEENYKPIANSSQIFEKLNHQTKEITTFQCGFKQQKYMGYLDATVESKGKFIFKKPNQIRWEYTDPYQYIIVINNGKLSFKSQGQNKGAVPKENKLFDQLNEIVESVFKGKLGLDNNFTTSIFESNISYKLNLLPKSADLIAGFKEINLWFDKTSLDIAGMQIVEASGDYTSLTFEKPIFNNTIPDSNFIIP